MKKLLNYLLLGCLIAVPVVVLGAEFRIGERTSVSESVNDDLYTAGDSVTIGGAVTGDAFAAGNNVVISGEVSEDVNAVGSSITIISSVADDVRAAGASIVIQGDVGGDALLAGANVTVSGAVQGELRVAGESIYIDGPVLGEVYLHASKIVLGPNAVIHNSLTYTSPNELVREEGTQVIGEVTFNQQAEKDFGYADFAGVLSFLFIVKFLALLVCALVVGLLLKRYSKEMVLVASARPFFEAGRGLVVMILIPIVSVLLMVTMVGIPLGIVGLIGFVALLVFAWIYTAVIVGSVVHQYFTKREVEISWKTILLGAVVYTLLGLVPFVGWIVQFIIMLISIGALTKIKVRVLKEWR